MFKINFFNLIKLNMAAGFFKKIWNGIKKGATWA